MSTDASTPIEDVLVFQQEQWVDGPPNELFKRLRGECPVHWSPRMEDFPEEAGYWSVTTADGVFEVSRDWQTYSSEKGGITAITNAILPLELMTSMFIAMDPPKHDRLKALFQRGFTPKRIAAVSYTHLRAHETVLDLVCRLLLEKKKKTALSTSSTCLNHTHSNIHPSLSHSDLCITDDDV